MRGRITQLQHHLRVSAHGKRGIVFQAIREFFRHRSLEAGASIAFYTLFSVFPLLILLTPTLGLLLEQEQVQSEIQRWLREVFPVAQGFEITQFIEDDLPQVVAQRRSINLIAALGLLWAGSNAFTNVAHNINRAWHTEAPEFDFLQGRLVALGMVVVVAAAVLITFIATYLLTILGQFDIPLVASVTHTPFWVVLTTIVPYVLSFVLFLLLYRYVPRTNVRWIDAAIGAIFTTVGWRLAAAAFVWLTSNGIAGYQAIYGSMATALITMLWIFVSSVVMLFGAHLAAAVAAYGKTEQGEEQPC